MLAHLSSSNYSLNKSHRYIHICIQTPTYTTHFWRYFGNLNAFLYMLLSSYVFVLQIFPFVFVIMITSSRCACVFWHVLIPFGTIRIKETCDQHCVLISTVFYDVYFVINTELQFASNAWCNLFHTIHSFDIEAFLS